MFLSKVFYTNHRKVMFRARVRAPERAFFGLTTPPMFLAPIFATLPAVGAAPIGQVQLQTLHGSRVPHSAHIPSADRFHAVTSY